MGNILLTGIDTLAVGFLVGAYKLTPEEWSELAAAKAEAQGTMFDSGGTRVTFRGQTFSVMPKGGKGYEYVLVNDDLTLQLSEKAGGFGLPGDPCDVAFSVSVALWLARGVCPCP